MVTYHSVSFVYLFKIRQMEPELSPFLFGRTVSDHGFTNREQDLDKIVQKPHTRNKYNAYFSETLGKIFIS